MSNIKVCEICGRTSKEICVGKYKGMMLCSKHRSQFFRHGEFSDDTIYAPNEYVLHDDYAEIILKDKYCNEVGRALIDLEDLEKCKEYKWHIRREPRTNYVIAHSKENPNKGVHLHKYVMDYNGNLEIDHENGDGLDNRKKNLKVCTHSENMRNQRNNRNGVKKVASGKYQVVFTHYYMPIYLGTYNTYEEGLAVKKAVCEAFRNCDNNCTLEKQINGECCLNDLKKVIPEHLWKNLNLNNTDNQYAERIL